jgi:hypothetical protein
MSRRDWLCAIIGWDGCLPWLGAFSPALLEYVLPDRDLAELTAVLVIPIIAALIRTHQGYRQIAKRVGRASLGRASLGRQFLFGCAIILLLIFESFSGVMHCARGIPPSGWLIAGAIYLGYLGLIVTALRPRRLVDA